MIQHDWYSIDDIAECSQIMLGIQNVCIQCRYLQLIRWSYMGSSHNAINIPKRHYYCELLLKMVGCRCGHWLTIWRQLPCRMFQETAQCRVSVLTGNQTVDNPDWYDTVQDRTQRVKSGHTMHWHGNHSKMTCCLNGRLWGKTRNRGLHGLGSRYKTRKDISTSRSIKWHIGTHRRSARTEE